ncbi:hypothetical protein [Cognatiyoonia sp. IB215182]|uniref:hypothetical protein n=1 Tax=Cognatiyoonia sp. IB215182 TaxID=3097353 RepID=UPI002A11069C|nr:hypothetical protein [Cognatiyoonia sp. IB215182]MDX8353963.1 hypothetical protein [Cognatiyoonia sp. IB215182]
MPELEAPQSILTLLDAIRTQIDVITTLSSGGLGAVILTWGRILGILDDADLSSFKRPGLLILPALLLLCAIVLGYLTGAQTTGYLTEVAQGSSASGTAITDAKEHYFFDYRNKFDKMMQVQFYASITGITLLKRVA